MWWAFVQAYSRVLVFPAAFVIGAIGYHVESWVRGDKEPTPWRESTIERREERKQTEGEEKFEVPKTIFDRAKKKDGD